MLDELRGARCLRAFVARPASTYDALVDVMVRVGGVDGLLMRHAAAVAELDLNPVIVSASGRRGGRRAGHARAARVSRR